MVIEKKIKAVPITGTVTQAAVNTGTLRLLDSPVTGKYSLVRYSKNGRATPICIDVARLSTINRYARCYGVEFTKGVK